MTADIAIEATPGQAAAFERDGFLVVAGPTQKSVKAERHDIVVFGPMAEGDRDISGQPYEVPGYGWGCSCHANAVGYPTEREAEDGADRHLAHIDRVPAPTTKPCPECGATGGRWHKIIGRFGEDKLIFTECPTCHGDGTVPIVVEVVVPPSGHCPAGWAATTEDACNYTGGHYCVRPRGHDSKQHRCACGVTTTRQDALPSPDEEGPARTLLRGTAEAVPVVEDCDDVPDTPSLVEVLGPNVIRYWMAGMVDTEDAIDITDHFADVPCPEVGDTAWIIRGEGS